MVSLPPYSAEPRAWLQWIPLLRKILSLLSSPVQGVQYFWNWVSGIHAINVHTDCYLNALHYFAITTEETVGSPNTQMALHAGMEEDRFNIQSVLSKLGIQEWKITMHFSKDKCKILHVGCYVHMEQVAPAQAWRTTKKIQQVISCR